MAAVPLSDIYLELRWEDWETLTLPPRLLPELKPPPLTPKRPPELEPNPLPPLYLPPKPPAEAEVVLLLLTTAAGQRTVQRSAPGTHLPVL